MENAPHLSGEPAPASAAHRVITIGRQYGSGGREIGRRVAAALGCAFYDSELLTLAAQRAGLHPDIAAKAEERPTNGLLYTAPLGIGAARGAAAVPVQQPLTERLFFAQSAVIRQLAETEDCVIIGRCADYVLRGHENLLSVFVYADPETRLDRCERYYGIDRATAHARIRQIDKRRAGYYTCFADQPWGSAESYDLLLDCGRFGVDGCADIIVRASGIARP